MTVATKFVYLKKELSGCRVGDHRSSGCPRLGPFPPRGMFTAHADLHCLQVIDGHVVCTTHRRQRTDDVLDRSFWRSCSLKAAWNDIGGNDAAARRLAASTSWIRADRDEHHEEAMHAESNCPAATAETAKVRPRTTAPAC